MICETCSIREICRIHRFYVEFSSVAAISIENCKHYRDISCEESQSLKKPDAFNFTAAGTISSNTVKEISYTREYDEKAIPEQQETSLALGGVPEQNMNTPGKISYHDVDYVNKAQQIRKLIPVPQDLEDDYIKASPENECEDCHAKGTDLLICCQCRKRICPNCVIETMNGEQYCQACDDDRPPDSI